MKIYFAGSIRGGREMQPTYQHIITVLQKAGHTVLSEHVGQKDLQEALDDRAIHDRDITWIEESELMIADVTLPSLGVGYEIAYAAYDCGIPILCIAKRDTNISAMIRGCPYVSIELYTDEYSAALGVLDWMEEAFGSTTD